MRRYYEEIDPKLIGVEIINPYKFKWILSEGKYFPIANIKEEEAHERARAFMVDNNLPEMSLDELWNEHIMTIAQQKKAAAILAFWDDYFLNVTPEIPNSHVQIIEVMINELKEDNVTLRKFADLGEECDPNQYLLNALIEVTGNNNQELPELNRLTASFDDYLDTIKPDSLTIAIAGAAVIECFDMPDFALSREEVQAEVDFLSEELVKLDYNQGNVLGRLKAARQILKQLSN